MVQVKNKILIIAEIGINHNGDMNITRKLIDMAKAAGCDAVKFQKRSIDLVYSQEILNSPRDSPWGKTQRDQKEGLEFGKQQYDEINDYCRVVGIEWFASAWDLESQEFLNHYDCKYNKVASAMLVYEPLLEKIAEERKHTLISTGMSSYNDIDRAIAVFKRHGCEYTLMHCVSTYPCKDEECNIGVILELQKRYCCPTGYSGHEVGILPTIAAVALGVSVIERHITLDRTMYGSDQAASLEMKGLEYVVKYARAMPAIFGDGVKRITEGENSVAKKLRYFQTG